MARTLDTNPADANDLVLTSFGSPNKGCTTPGPGEGVGGLSTNFTNCVGLKQVLILQQEDNAKAIPNQSGGDIVFQFGDFANRVTELTLFNVQSAAQIIFEVDGGLVVLDVVPTDANAVEKIELDVSNVAKMTVRFTGLGAIASLGVCVDKTETRAPVGIRELEPTAAPTVTPQPASGSCPYDDVVLYDKVGETVYPEIPIVILEQNTATVTFAVHNTFFEQVDRVYVQFRTTPYGDEKCYETEYVEVGEFAVYTAECMHNVPISIVEFWVSDDSVLDNPLDDAVVPLCCEPPLDDMNPKVQYTFKLYCVPQCPDDQSATRKLANDRGNFLRGRD
jgi:hypothetical protein